MRQSIRIKISLMLGIVSGTIIILSWLLCTFFIKDFIISDVTNNLKVAYKSCNEYFSFRSVEGAKQAGDLYGNINNPLDAMILVVDSKNSTIYTSINDESRMMESLSHISKSSDANNLSIETVTVLEKNKQYIIQQNHDSLLKADYYDLVGKLDNDFLIIIRSPIEQVDNTVKMFTKVFVIISFILIICGCVLVLIMSNVFAKPIKNMAGIAKRMACLDFDAKVSYESKDEIGDLGKSMNEMSLKLEKTISELKEANIQLEKDISDKLQIDEMRKEFLSHVSHELKTPIALVQGYAEGLKDNIFDDDDNKDFYCDVIIDEASKMNTMVKKLLDLNEIEFGDAKLDIHRFELTSFLQEIISATKILMDDKNSEIEFSESNLTYVWADEFLIEDVFTNYLTNAIHYVKDNGKIIVSIENKGENVRVNVFNEGENIDNEDIKKLFIKFYKADKARTREYGGSGIGLSIVAAAMEAHHKEYGVYNTSNGVVFYFELDAKLPC